MSFDFGWLVHNFVVAGVFLVCSFFSDVDY